MQKKLFLFFSFFYFSLNIMAQGPFLDSLNNNLAHSQTDVQKVDALMGIADYYHYRKSDPQAIITLKKALTIANHTNLTEKKIEVMAVLGGIYFNSGPKVNKDTAYQLTDTIVAIAQKEGLYGPEAEQLSYRSGQSNGSNKDSARIVMQQALKLLKNFPDYEKAAMVSWLQSLVYRNQVGDMYSALMYANQAVLFAEKSNKPKVKVLTLMNAGDLFSLQQKPDSANKIRLEALSVARNNNLLYSQLDILSSFLSVHSGVLRDSLNQFYNDAMNINRYMDNAHDSLSIMNDYAQSNGSLGNYPRAMQTFLLVLDASEKRKDSGAVSLAMCNIIEMYEAVNDYRSANKYVDKLKLFTPPISLYGVNINMYYALNYAFLHQKDSAALYAHLTEKNAKIYFIDSDKTNAWGGVIFGGVYNTLGRAYLEMGNDSLALDRLRKSYYYFKHLYFNDYSNLYEAAYGIALYFTKQQQQDSAYWYAKQVIQIGTSQGFTQYTPDAANILVHYFQEKELPDSALIYQLIGDKAYKSLFNAANETDFLKVSLEEQQRLQQISAAQQLKEEQYKNNLKIYALLAVLLVAIIIAVFILRSNRQRQKAYALLQKQKQEIDNQKQKVENTLADLKSTQAQLVQSEKMASLGELTAGIAHEIQNPLNFVNNFSEVNKELVDELQTELKSGNVDEAINISNDIKDNEEKINHHGKRADAIVKGMLQHSRQTKGVKESTDINSLCDEYLRLAYHGLRAKDKEFNADFKTHFDEKIGKINIVPQDIGRVLLNLINNAFYATNEKLAAHRSPLTDDYKPLVSVQTKKINDNKVEIKISDNGNGILQNMIDKIFQPFFTTKPTGQGTGLGLSLSYDIIKAHGGEIKVETKEDEGTTFIIQLPI